jgi:hypothetical protein
VKSIIVIILICISFHILADDEFECELHGRVKYILDKNEIIESADYCIQEITGHIISKSCYGEKSKCQALAASGVHIERGRLTSEFGTPVFKVCRIVGGSPQIFSYFKSGKWIEISRCLFPDKSFIDNDFLYRRQKIE